MNLMYICVPEQFLMKQRSGSRYVCSLCTTCRDQASCDGSEMGDDLACRASSPLVLTLLQCSLSFPNSIMTARRAVI